MGVFQIVVRSLEIHFQVTIVLQKTTRDISGCPPIINNQSTNINSHSHFRLPQYHKYQGLLLTVAHSYLPSYP